MATDCRHWYRSDSCGTADDRSVLWSADGSAKGSTAPLQHGQQRRAKDQLRQRLLAAETSSSRLLLYDMISCPIHVS